MAETFPIVDAHVHLWNPQQLHLPWLADIPHLNQPYGLLDYREQTWGLPIEGIVYVEVGATAEEALSEARHIANLAREEPLLKAIVAAAPVEHGEKVRAHLESLLSISPLIKGVRRNIQDETEPDFCLQPDFVAGVRLLAEYSLSFDLCIKHWQLPSVIELVRLCPDTVFILDHLGKPDIQHQQLEPWKTSLRALAELPNVACKLSGMVTEADHANWQPADLEPYIATVFGFFGPDRVMFGSDWPVALLASSYRRWYETLASLSSHLSLSKKRKLWAENATRFYITNGASLRMS